MLHKCLLNLKMSHCIIVVVQLLSHVWLFATTWTVAHQASLPFTVSQSLLKFMSIESVMPSSISSSDVSFSYCPQSFTVSGSFPMSWLFPSGGQSIGVSASASVLPVNIQDWIPLGLVWSPCSPRDSQEFSPILQLESINFGTQPLWSNSHIHTWLLEKP